MQSAEDFIAKLVDISQDPKKLAIMCEKINQGKKKPILSQQQLTVIYNYILTKPKLVQNLTKLQVNKSIRFAKAKKQLRNRLPRTCVIQRFPDGHLELIVMPNRKLANGERVDDEQQHGTKKKLKVAYRIDDVAVDNIKKARLRVELYPNPAEIMANLTKEAAISQKMIDSKYAAPIFVGSAYEIYRNKQKTTAVYAFSDMALYDLKWIMTQPINYPIKLIVTTLLRGLVDMHNKNIIHANLELRNIVLARESTGELYIKFIDFDRSIDLDKDLPGSPSSSNRMTSPENSHHYIRHKNYSKELCAYLYVTAPQKYKNYSQDLYVAAIINKTPYIQQPYLDFKDNCWSIGVIIFLLLTRNEPRNDEYTKFILQSNPLLRGLLAPSREERFSAKEALHCWLSNPNLKSVSKEQFKKMDLLSQHDEEEGYSCMDKLKKIIADILLYIGYDKPRPNRLKL